MSRLPASTFQHIMLLWRVDYTQINTTEHCITQPPHSISWELMLMLRMMSHSHPGRETVSWTEVHHKIIFMYHIIKFSLL